MLGQSYFEDRLNEMYNLAKHEVNKFEERPRLFCEADAVVSYFTARIIGKVVLNKLNYHLPGNTYKIVNG